VKPKQHCLKNEKFGYIFGEIKKHKLFTSDACKAAASSFLARLKTNVMRQIPTAICQIKAWFM